jgi:gamma-glutamyltranspeptidase/glutathione hydrolase
MNYLIFKRNLAAFLIFIYVLVPINIGIAQGNPQHQHGNYAEGTNGIVATAHPLATEAGYEMLKLGGNAIDAAIAAAFAIGVVEPDGSGLGGGGGMVIYLQKEKKSIFINYYQTASEKINEINFDSERDRKSAKSILVPGTVAGLTAALSKYGTLPLSTVLQPAVKYAEQGFPIDKTLASLILDNVALLQIFEPTSSIFLSDGFPMMEGEILLQKDLANTLKAIVERGDKGFYEGEIAERMVSQITQFGGKITLNDLKNYKPIISEAVSGTYRGYKILSAGLPQSGTTVIEALNMLEKKNLNQMGHFSKNPETLHLLAETLRRVYADRSAYMADPRFETVPLEGLLSKNYARVRFEDIDENYANPPEYRKTKEGNPFAFSNKSEQDNTKVADDKIEYFSDDDDDEQDYSAKKKEDIFDSWGRVKKKTNNVKTIDKQKPTPQKDVEELEQEFDGHTTHLSVVDKDGNIVSLTQTLGTFFGSGFTSEGVLFNCSMTNYSANLPLNAVKPGKQPRTSIAPTVILKDDQPFMVVGSPGATRIISTVVQLIVNVIDFQMNITEANDAPRMFCQKFDDYLHLESRFPDDVISSIKKKGHNVRVYGDYDLFFGGAQMILIDWDNKKFYGSADLRRGGSALGF